MDFQSFEKWLPMYSDSGTEFKVPQRKEKTKAAKQFQLASCTWTHSAACRRREASFVSFEPK